MGEYAGLGEVTGKRVLVRSDLNVPLDGTRITDDGRIRASVPTIKALADAGARVVVTAHLGRPKGEPEDRYSLRPVAVRLGELLGRDVAFATDTVGDSARETVDGLADGEVALLENVRFNAGETSKDDAERGEFADQLAELADAFVSDGFGVVHRKQASVYDVAQRLPHAMGGLVAAELDVMKRLTEDPERPYVVVLGGSKVSDKLGVIDHLLGKADTLLIGGGMVFTFLKAQGHDVGKSLLEEDQVDVCAEYLQRAEDTGVRIVLPTDIVVDTEFPSDDRDPQPRVVPADAIPSDALGLDIGPDSARAFAEAIAGGPHGLLERADGRLRDPGLRRGDPRRRQGPDQGGRALRGRRRRLRGRGPRARLRRGRVRPHLDRRRRQPRVPRGQGAARTRRTGRLTSHGPPPAPR